MTGLGRYDSLTTGSFREAKLQRRLSGDEPAEAIVVSRPLCIVRSYEYELKRSMPTPLRKGRRHAHLVYIIYRVFKNANNESGA
jgi:hypothetical protein